MPLKWFIYFNWFINQMFPALCILLLLYLSFVEIKNHYRPNISTVRAAFLMLTYLLSMPWSMVKKIGAMEWSMEHGNMVNSLIRSKRCHWMNLHLLLSVKWMRLESVEMHKSLAHILNGGPGLLRPKEQWSAKIKDQSKSKWIYVNRCKEGKSIKVSQPKIQNCL